jgi:hypothetical protein
MQQIQVQKKILLQDHVSGSIQTSESHKEAFKTEKGQELKTTSYCFQQFSNCIFGNAHMNFR